MEFLLPVLTILLSAGLSLAVSIHIAKRERRNRERVTFLMQAYRVLVNATNRPRIANPHEFEAALSDIGLLGDPEQIRLATEFSEEFQRTGNAELAALLDSLRRSLRRELSLSEDIPRMPILRITNERGVPGA